MMRLYHLPNRRSTRVLWALEELGVPFDVTVLTREDKASGEHRRRHPLGRVPVLELDDGQQMFESLAICLQLADLYPRARLIPELGTADRARVYQWALFAVTEIEPHLFALRPGAGRQEDKSQRLNAFVAAATVLSEAVGEGPWLLGETFTVADIIAAGVLGVAKRVGVDDQVGGLPAYVERARARPASVRARALGT